MRILVTGSSGMIGSHVVEALIEKGYSVIGADRRSIDVELGGFEQVLVDLSKKDEVEHLFDSRKIDRVIHLAALAHTDGVKDTSWDAFKKVNVDCAEIIFRACAMFGIPVLFISTVDAIGMVKGVIKPETQLNPISNYGKSKAMAEGRLKEICSRWDIYRFSPVYTPEIKRDIEKRYYLKYPNWAYKIGNGGRFEVLSVNRAVAAMVDWVESGVDKRIQVIKDPELLDVNEMIAAERKEGRAKHVLRLPRWMVVCGYYLLRIATGKSNMTYLIFKALWPYRTDE